MRMRCVVCGSFSACEGGREGEDNRGRKRGREGKRERIRNTWGREGETEGEREEGRKIQR